MSNLTDVISVATGYYHTCALRSGGTVSCWGLNYIKQVGDGTTIIRNTPTAVTGGLSGVTAIAVASNYSCALKSDGTVTCWGGLPNSSSPIANGLTAISGVTGAKKIVAGGQHACALKSDSSVFCWGWNNRSQLGNGSSPSSAFYPAQVVKADSLGANLANVAEISAGDTHTCAVSSNQTVKCWGNNNSWQLGYDKLDPTQWNYPRAVSGVSNAIAVAAGMNFTCALISGGQVMCWGNNDHGQLGDGGTTSRYTPGFVSGLNDAVAIAAASSVYNAGDSSLDHSYACALRATGAVVCWGANQDGQLGNGSTTDSTIPVTTSEGAVFWH